MTQASVLRTSSTGFVERRSMSGYQCRAFASVWLMRSPSCTSACWMCRGFLSSWRYSVSCWSFRWRPNQVFHQKRKGMRTMSHPVAKKRSFWVRDMLRLAGASATMLPFRPSRGSGVGREASGLDGHGVPENKL